MGVKGCWTEQSQSLAGVIQVPGFRTGKPDTEASHLQGQLFPCCPWEQPRVPNPKTDNHFSSKNMQVLVFSVGKHNTPKSYSKKQGQSLRSPKKKGAVNKTFQVCVLRLLPWVDLSVFRCDRNGLGVLQQWMWSPGCCLDQVTPSTLQWWQGGLSGSGCNVSKTESV